LVAAEGQGPEAALGRFVVNPFFAPKPAALQVSSTLDKSPLFAQNKPNVKIGRITISPATTEPYLNKQRTMNNEHHSKQTQTNPIPPLSRLPPLPKSNTHFQTSVETRHPIYDLRNARYASRDTTFGLFGRANCLLTLRIAARTILINYRKRLQRTTLVPVGKAISNV